VWNWGVFVGSLVVCSIAVMFARGAMNDSNMVRYGAQADYRTNTGHAIFGSILAGTVFAAIITAVIGMFG
jgi:hypothetical protein